MEIIGVPLVPFIRSLGPPLVVLAVGAVLLVRRRPVRARLMWAALAVQLAAAAMPYAWLAVQAATGLGGQSWVGLVMIMLQPGVDAIAWLLALAAVVTATPQRAAVGGPQTAAHPPDAPASPARVAGAAPETRNEQIAAPSTSTKTTATAPQSARSENTAGEEGRNQIGEAEGSTKKRG